MASDLLERFEITVLKNKSGSDTAQVPAQAAINLYHRGATAAEGKEIPNPGATVSVLVYDVGRVQQGDQLRAGTSEHVLNVTHVDSDSKMITVEADTGGFSLTAGTRLVITSPRPSFYSDPHGTVSVGSSLTSSSSDGRAGAYVAESRFDYMVSGTGITTRLYADAGVDSAQIVFEALSFNSIQDAINACPPGGRVHISAGTYTAPTGGLVINKAIEVFGDAPVPGATSGTVLRAPSVNDHVLVVCDAAGPDASDIYLHGLSIMGSASIDPLVSGTGDGIHVSLTGEHGVISGVRLERIEVSNTRHGFYVGSEVLSGKLGPVSLLDCSAHDNSGDGIHLWRCRASIQGGASSANGAYGLWVDGSGVDVVLGFEPGLLATGLLLDGNQRLATQGQSPENAALRVYFLDGVNLSGCTFKDFAIQGVHGPYSKIGILLDACSGRDHSRL